MAILLCLNIFVPGASGTIVPRNIPQSAEIKLNEDVDKMSEKFCMLMLVFGAMVVVVCKEGIKLGKIIKE